jgi:hypothetical protein
MPTLMDQLAPSIVASIQADKDRIIASSGAWIDRTAIRIAWPLAMDLLPTMLAHGYAAIVKEFGTMHVNELVVRLEADMKTVQLREQQQHGRQHD